MKNSDYSQYCDLLQSTVIPSTLTPEEQSHLLQPLTKWIVDHTPAKLYKFRRCNENNINAFRNQQIWFATPSTMNDDYDAALLCDKDKILSELNSLFDNNGMLHFLNYLRAGGAAPQVIIDAFSQDGIINILNKLSNTNDIELNNLSTFIKNWAENGFNNQFHSISQVIQNVVKISCFSENIYSPLMWGHYADNSTGFALAYDFRNGEYNYCPHCDRIGKLCFSPKSNSLYPIVYVDKRINATDYARYLMQDAMTQQLLYSMNAPKEMAVPILKTITCPDIFMHTKTLLHKFKDWQYEKEWRMTISYDSPNYSKDKTAYIRKKPIALYLGRKIKDTDELVLRNIAYQQKIPVYKMDIDETSTNYRLKPIRQKNTIKQLILK